MSPIRCSCFAYVHLLSALFSLCVSPELHRFIQDLFGLRRTLAALRTDKSRCGLSVGNISRSKYCECDDNEEHGDYPCKSGNHFKDEPQNISDVRPEPVPHVHVKPLKRRSPPVSVACMMHTAFLSFVEAVNYGLIPVLVFDNRRTINGDAMVS